LLILGGTNGRNLPHSLREVLYVKTLVSTASDRVPRYGRAEIRILPAVEVGPLRRRMDELARERRELDTAIQQANWAIDLTEG
jgi:hypothetical protein